jgi:hypothetical protein
VPQVAEQVLTCVSWFRRELLGVADGCALPPPQLPATAGADTDARLAAAVAKSAAAAAAEEAQSERAAPVAAAAAQAGRT